MRIDWTPERRAILERLWLRDQLPQSIIAARLGVTKQAVLAARRRFGLPARGAAVASQREGTGTRAGPVLVALAAAGLAAAPAPAPAPPTRALRLRRVAPEPLAARVEGIDLPAPPCRCAWPLWGDGIRPRDAARYCDAPIRRGRAYCDGHHRVAYRRPGEPWDRSSAAPPLARAA